MRLEASEREAREEAERQRRRSAALEQVSRSIVARVDLREILEAAADAGKGLTGAVFGMFEPTFTGTEVIRREDIAGTPLVEHAARHLALPAVARRSAATWPSRSRRPRVRSRAACSSGTRSPACSTRTPKRRPRASPRRRRWRSPTPACWSPRTARRLRARSRCASAIRSPSRCSRALCRRTCRRSRGSSWVRTTTRAPSWSAATSTTSSRSPSAPGASSSATSAAAGPRRRRRPPSPATPSGPRRCSRPSRRRSCTRSTARCCARTPTASPPPSSCASSFARRRATS